MTKYGTFTLLVRLEGMKKQIFYFGFRYDETLEHKINRYCRLKRLSLNKLAARAFRNLTALHDRKKVLFDWRSRFLARIDRHEKTEVTLVHSREQRELLRNFAFAYRVSMAEVLRIALEIYLAEALGKSDKVKHVYEHDKPIKTSTLILLFPAYPCKEPIDTHYEPPD